MIFLSCSVKKLALKSVSRTLTGTGGDVFTSENDYDLIGDSLPVILKLYDSMIAEMPEDRDLLFAAGKLYTMYAFAYVFVPMEIDHNITVRDKEKGLIRAKNLYLRARNYIIRSLSTKKTDFLDEIKKDPKVLDIKLENDMEKLYYLGLSWMGAYTSDKFDMELSISSKTSIEILKKCLEADETFNRGVIHDFFVSYYGSLPVSMGGSKEKAREHYKRALALSEGKRGSLHISLALAVSVAEQKHEEFRELMKAVMAIDTENASPERLENIIAKKRAEFYLRNIEDYFLLD